MPAAMTCMGVIRSLVVHSPPANRQACFLICWRKISAGKSVELSKLHKILYFSFMSGSVDLKLFFLSMTRQTAKSMQILFCFFRRPYRYCDRQKIRFCLFRKFHTFSVRHAESAYLRSKYTPMHISSSHVCFAALCDGILGINNISQFSGINRKAFNSPHVIACMSLPACHWLSCTTVISLKHLSLSTFLPLPVSVQFNMCFICTLKQFSIVLIIIVVVTWVYWTKRYLS